MDDCVAHSMMVDTEYSTLVVVGMALALAVATPLAAGIPIPAAQDATVSSAQESATGQEDVRIRAQDEPTVEIHSFSAESMTLRNVTATDVLVRELTVRQLGQRENVTLRNVSLQRVVVERAELTTVRFQSLVLRGEDLLTDFGVHYARGTNVTNESRQHLRIQNRTLDGVVIESLTVQNASGLNLPSSAVAEGDGSINESAAALVVGNASASAVQSFDASFGNETETGTTAADANTTTESA